MITISFDMVMLLILFLLILLSAFFSGSETGITAMNRYRLQHLARKKFAPAVRIRDLLMKPERLLGVILVGNTLSNIIASALTTMLTVHFYGAHAVWWTTLVLTCVILIFSEVTPKTLAVLYPERFAFFASMPLKILLYLFYPVVWVVSSIANGLLRLCSVETRKSVFDTLSAEELRGMLLMKGGFSSAHQNMLLGVLDLEKMTVNDIMVPRQEIMAIDVNEPWTQVLNALRKVRRLRILAYRGSVNHPLGFIYLPKIITLLIRGCLNKNSLLRALEPVQFIPEGTLLNQQLINFQKHKLSIGLIVDEYGDVQGLVSLDDIVEEIIGEFVQYSPDLVQAAQKKPDGSYWLSGCCYVRDLNRRYDWSLPVEGPNTLSGLIIEHLEFIPSDKIGMRIAGYPIEVLKVKDNKVDMVRILPHLRLTQEEEA